jgi:hypothetical protein
MGRGQLLGQLIAALLAIELVLLAVDGIGLGEDLLGDLLIVTVAVMRSVRVNLRAVDRDHPDLHHPRVRTQRQHRAKQARQRVLMTRAKASDRRVIGLLVRGDHAVGDVLNALALDPARGALPPRVRVKQQRDHHRRIVRRATMPIAPISAIEPSQIHLPDRVQHE